MKNPGQTVSQGTLIPAVLETAINSDLPGYVRAVVSRTSAASTAAAFSCRGRRG